METRVYWGTGGAKEEEVACSCFSKKVYAKEVENLLYDNSENLEYIDEEWTADLEDWDTDEDSVNDDGDIILGRRNKTKMMLCAENERLPKEDALNIVDKILENLTPREGKILTMRFGFFDGTVWALEQIGHQFSCTRENVRHFEKKALRKLHDMGKEFSFLQTAYRYVGLSAKYYPQYLNAVLCKECKTKFILADGRSQECPKCKIKDDCLDRLDLDDFVVFSETEDAFVFRHICGTKIDYPYDSHRPLLCSRCEEEKRARLALIQKTSAKQLVVRDRSFDIIEESESELVLRHTCGREIRYPYSSQAALECTFCKQKETARTMIDLGEFSIEGEQSNYYCLRHICGKETSYFYESKRPPRCDDCHNEKARTLIRSAGFEIIGKYDMGYRIHHPCGWQRKFNFDCAEAPECWHCTQAAAKNAKVKRHKLPLDLTLLENIDATMAERLKAIGIDNTRSFLYKRTGQIYRQLVELDLSIELSDILIIEAAKQHRLVSDFNENEKEDLLVLAKECKAKVLRGKQEEAEKGRQLTGLPNIGLERAKRLESIGFICAEDLVTSTLTTEEIWKQIFAIFPEADFTEIYAIEGARNRIQTKMLSKERKQELRSFVESIKGPYPWGL